MKHRALTADLTNALGCVEDQSGEYRGVPAAVLGEGASYFKYDPPQIVLEQRSHRSPSDVRRARFLKHLEGFKWILDLEHGWDGDQSQPIAEDIWARAVEAAFGSSEALYRAGRKPLLPAFSPCVDGSLDVLWKRGAGCHFLANFDERPLVDYAFTAPGGCEGEGYTTLPWLGHQIAVWAANTA